MVLVRLTTGTEVGDVCLNDGGERRRDRGDVGYCPCSEAFVSEAGVCICTMFSHSF